MDLDLTEDLLKLLEDRRQRASTRRDALRSDLDDIVERSSDASRDDEHDPEGATIAFERAQVAALLSAAEQELVDVDLALERMRSGVHGRCGRCGDEIPPERLRARPTTHKCIDCAQTEAGRRARGDG
jgi:DnaK suppressor protein